MKFLLPVIITIMALFAPLSLFAVGKNGDQHIKSIFFQKNEGREIVQIRLSEKVVPKIFELDGEKPRVVLDFIGTTYQQNKIRTIKAGGSLVKRIRVGRHDKPIAKTRVVIDIVEGVKYSFTEEYLASSTIFKITFTAPQLQQPEEKIVAKAKAKNIASESIVSNEKNKIEQVPGAQIVQQKVEQSVEQEQENIELTEKKTTADIQKTSKTIEIEQGEDVAAMKEDALQLIQEENAGELQAAQPRVEDEKQQVLLDVNFEKSTNGYEMVLFHLNGFYPPVVYSAESGELFVVCDFLDAQIGPDVVPVIANGGNFIRQIRVESFQQPQKVRVVLELAEDYAYDLKQVFFKEENLFVVILNSLDEKKKEN